MGKKIERTLDTMPEIAGNVVRRALREVLGVRRNWDQHGGAALHNGLGPIHVPYPNRAYRWDSPTELFEPSRARMIAYPGDATGFTVLVSGTEAEGYDAEVTVRLIKQADVEQKGA